MKTQDVQEKLQTIEHPASGRHLLLTLRGCDPAVIDDAKRLEQATSEACLATGATILQIVTQKFEPNGVTVVAVLAESHASLHTYPEEGVVFWDCFTCGETCDPQRSISVLSAALSPASVESRLIGR